jgi:hypothetical protein
LGKEVELKTWDKELTQVKDWLLDTLLPTHKEVSFFVNNLAYTYDFYKGNSAKENGTITINKIHAHTFLTKAITANKELASR